MKVGIVGVRGLLGEELLKALLGHSKAELVYLGSEEASGEDITEVGLAKLKGVFSTRCRGVGKKEILENGVEVVFLSSGHGRSMDIVPWLLEEGVKVIDLSGDYRLRNADLYDKYYKYSHTHKDLLEEAAYGLPELNREEIKNARFVANPGCYATGALLGIAPVVEFIRDCVIIHALSGISGVGRSYDPKKNNLFLSCYGNIRAYTIKEHPHIPEIQEKANLLLNKRFKIIRFTPHLVPIDRGIYMTIYAEIKEDSKTNDINEIANKFYKDKKFIRIFNNPEHINIENIKMTNFCDISYYIEDNILQIFVALDNLSKGGATQAIQNMNLIYGLPEEYSLLPSWRN